VTRDATRICYQSYVDEEHGADYWRYLRDHLTGIVNPGTSVDIIGITPHDSYAHPVVELRCAREMICNAVRAEQDGYDAFIVGHFQDSGLYEARSAVDIPVLALGEASMLYCCQLAQHIGIITINPRFIPGFRHQIARYGLQNRVIDIYAMRFEPGQIMAAFGSPARTAEVKRLFHEQAQPLVKAGVELLLPGGGIPMLLFADEREHEVDGAPVVNGIQIVFKMAELAVYFQRRSGLGVSRVGDFIKPPPEIIDEFLHNPKLP
jgi:Asp/Glu/hydantoin racemase